VRLLIALVIWVVALAGAVEVSSVVAGSIHNGSAAATSGTSGGSGSTSSGTSGPDPSSITATDSLSLFRTANFAKALTLARSAVGVSAQLDNFVVYPGYLSMTAVKSGSEIDVYVDANGRSEVTQTGGSPGGTQLFGLSRISPGIPALLARRISRGAHVPESQLHYMVAEAGLATGKFEWLVYPTEGNRVEYFVAAGGTGQLSEYLHGSSSGPQPVGG